MIQKPMKSMNKKEDGGVVTPFMENFYTCRRCGVRIDKKNITEVVTHHRYACAEKSYLCESCYKSFVRFMKKRRMFSW